MTPGCDPCRSHSKHQRTRSGLPWHTGEGLNCPVCGVFWTNQLLRWCDVCDLWAAEEIEYLTLMAAMGERINAKTVR